MEKNPHIETGVKQCDSNGNDDHGKSRKKAIETWIFGTKFQLTPRKLTISLKINGWKMTCRHVLLKWFLFRGHVHFRGCRISQKWSKEEDFIWSYFFGLSLSHLSGLHRIVRILEHEPGRRWTAAEWLFCRKESLEGNFLVVPVAPNDQDISELVLHCTYLWVVP